LNKESNATSKVKELSAKISTIEHRTIHFESMSTSNDAKESGGSGVELSSMKIELNAAKSELKLAQQQVETFKEISQASEDRLAEMNSTFDIYKTETDKLTMDLQAKVQNLEADRLGLVEKLAQVSRTLTETQEKMDAQVEAFNASNNIYETQIRSLKANEERALKSVAGIKSDLDRQCKSIQEVQENYEREVMAHSTSLNTLNELKQKNMRLIAEKDTLAVEKGSIETELNNSKESFEVIKSKLENQIKELEKRLADLNTQNQLLHATFEQLSASKHLVPDEDGEPGVESKTITDLREVIQFLRREKEIADTKLQLATQEAQRNLIQIQQLQKSLEESRICVEEERKRNLDLSGTERQHRELLEKIEQANLLRESNITLRSHLESAHNQVSQLETKLKSTESSIEPLKSKKTLI
jgi:nucleoprotein TPR